MASFTDSPLVITIAALVVYLTTLAASRISMYAKFLPDNPNGRSSHVRVTSRAGGIGIFGGWIAGIFILAAFSGSAEATFVAVKLAGISVLAFCLGLADDKWALSPLVKFCGQVVAAGLFTWLLGPLQVAPIPFIGEVPLGLWGTGLTIIWIVGFMNAFNFMDGVNGIAAGSALTGLVAFAVIALLTGAPVAAVLAIFLAIACFAFLPANLGKGRLFMGDSGSQALSFLIAALGIYAANATAGHASAMLVPVIFLPFIFDVGWTLTHRLMRGQNILDGHREHLYQLLLRQGFSHTKIAVLYMSLTAFSAAVAIFMLTLSPGGQWLAVALLCALFSMGAAYIHVSALRAGLLTTGERASVAAHDGAAMHQAAE
jgi:UDP-N-acetylmuramyl pentapeptide phosphotransferase/UDP-N-acetylglucosamine-1-phosphate transferase